MANLEKIKENNKKEIEQISPKELLKGLTSDVGEKNKTNEMFICKSANQWNKESLLLPKKLQLFDEFIQENELAVLFAETGAGKSLLSVQIAQSIASSIPIYPFTIQTNPQTVLYFDLELSQSQFLHRAINPETKEQFIFSENLKRAEFSKDYESENYEIELLKSIENTIIETDAKVLIIDNITYLAADLEKGNVAGKLLKKLNRIKKKYNITLIVIAHTPKRDTSRPISLNDLAGSRQIANLIDSCIAIGKSTNDTSIRYIKQLKTRNNAIKYDADNVCVCQIDYKDNLVGLQFLKYDSENRYLVNRGENEKQQTVNDILDLHKSGLSTRKIAEKIGMSHTYVSKIIKQNIN